MKKLKMLIAALSVGVLAGCASSPNVVSNAAPGFDVAEYLGHDHDQASPSLSVEAFASDWGIDMSLDATGGVSGVS